MKRLLLITLLIGYIYPCVAQDKPIRTEESLEEMCIRDSIISPAANHDMCLVSILMHYKMLGYIEGRQSTTIMHRCCRRCV